MGNGCSGAQPCDPSHAPSTISYQPSTLNSEPLTSGGHRARPYDNPSPPFRLSAFPPRYVELHLHTAFSFLDGASLPEEMIGRALELGYRSLAVTDHDGLYGAMEFAQLADDAGIFPITGAELTLTDESHITLLAASHRGYANLSKLITEAHRLPPEWQRRGQRMRCSYRLTTFSCYRTVWTILDVAIQRCTEADAPGEGIAIDG